VVSWAPELEWTGEERKRIEKVGHNAIEIAASIWRVVRE